MLASSKIFPGQFQAAKYAPKYITDFKCRLAEGYYFIQS
jgi:hypothetical protein